ncbi:MAG: N-acetyltransferase [Candidatus Aenigmarchaeota archaeon]|nr:N-acetyltransferase [Candidatus Aenigmarchaeota archaeon]
MKIRIAKQNDAAEVAALLKKHYEDIYKGSVTFDKKYILRKMKEKTFYVVACDNEINNKIVGCNRTSIVDIDLAELRMLCLDEKYRGRRMGKKLMAETLNFLKKKKMRKVVARVKPNNKLTISMLKSFGFKKEAYLKEHFRKGQDIIQFYKFL